MVWEVLAIWAIVVPTLVWFVRDERQRRHLLLDAQARRYAVTPYRRPRRQDDAGAYLKVAAE